MSAIILYSIVAGVVGTGIGGLITIILGNKSASLASAFLSFAAGIMISIVCFGLIPRALDLAKLPIVLFGVTIGVIVIMGLNYIVDIFTKSRNPIHENAQELYHEKAFIESAGNFQMYKAGIIILVAISLHNFPEGFAIGAGGAHDQNLGLIISLMIALHNIPEGIAIATPLLIGGVKKYLVVLLTMLSGLPTLFGALGGLLIGNISNAAIALSLAGAGGAMLYVVFGEIIPQVIIERKSRTMTIITLVGILIGLLISYV